jgi:FAD/FMN-containing dehydrogenase
MLTGGFGFLSRLHGLSLDNLVEVEMVLADGRIVIVNANSHPELWWAVRGAGPAFGIATRYKAIAHPVPVVFAGNLIYRFHRATAPSLLKHYRDCVKGAPRELYANLLLTAGPADKDSLVVIQLCYVGPRERGAEFLQAISAWNGEPCLLNEVDEKSFLNQQDSVAQVLRGQRGRKWYIRSTLITSLPDEVITKTVTQFANTPIGCTWLFELSGGALADHENNCIPHSQREAHFNVAALHQWDLHVDDPRCKVSAEEWIDKTLAPVSTGAPFTCFLGRDEPFQRVQNCFGEENFDKLAALKRKYDPNCLFKHTFWPLDASGEAIEPAVREPQSP